MADINAYSYYTTLNRCDNKTYLIRNNYGSGFGSPGEFFCWNDEVYEILSLGGGGTTTVTVATFYPDYATAFAACPCGLDPQPPTDRDWET